MVFLAALSGKSILFIRLKPKDFYQISSVKTDDNDKKDISSLCLAPAKDLYMKQQGALAKNQE